jgi:hypothetical protein
MGADCIQIEAQRLRHAPVSIIIRYKLSILMYLKVNICLVILLTAALPGPG